MTRTLLVALVALAALLSACGETQEIREPDVVIQAANPRPPRGGQPLEADDGRPRIMVVTHGKASSEFWAIVRNGAEAAGREADANMSYRSPDSYSVSHMRRLINDAVDTKPDGLVVSVPSDEVIPAVRRAVLDGIPVVTINSGGDQFRRIGAMAHIGQPEDAAGYAAGLRLARAGVRRGVCLNQEAGNAGLRLRCSAFARAMRAEGARAEMVTFDPESPSAQRRVRAAVAQRRADGALTLGSDGANVAMRALQDRPDVRLATFDISPEILAGLQSGRMLFAVDQQPYLQGYLPVLFLAKFARYGLFPAQDRIVPTGPNFVTAENAARVEQLSRVQIR